LNVGIVAWQRLARKTKLLHPYQPATLGDEKESEINLASPCFGSNVNTTEGIENGFAFAYNWRVVYWRKVGRTRFERSVNCPDWDNCPRSFDSSCWPGIPRETDSIKLFLHGRVEWLRGRRWWCIHVDVLFR
jgi:hypothetical protein